MDFNQGLDARLLTEHHARRLAELTDATIRLALDHQKSADQWESPLKCYAQRELPSGASVAMRCADCTYHGSR